MKHKHYECIVAWAEGKLVQFKNIDGKWEDLNKEGFGWWPHREYRIKPEEKINNSKYYNIGRLGKIYQHNDSEYCDLKVTFDSENGEFISLEVFE
jgi:hypothetical protein